MTTLSKNFQSTHPIGVAVLASAVATLASYALPDAYAGETVGAVFLGATYWACLRADHPIPPREYGLHLGGLFSPQPIDLRQMAVDFARALTIASLIACLIFPPFWWGFVTWYHPTHSFSLARALHGDGLSAAFELFNLVLAHVLVVALPEEVFFRGYLQSSLARRYPPKRTFWGLQISTALLISSAIFALGHFTTTPHAGRLAVFFPSLLFGILRDKTGGTGASIFLHAQCNVFAALLGQGYGLY